MQCIAAITKNLVMLLNGSI